MWGSRFQEPRFLGAQHDGFDEELPQVADPPPLTLNSVSPLRSVHPQAVEPPPGSRKLSQVLQLMD